MVDDEEAKDWLGIDLSGIQPEVVRGVGHNSEAEIIGRVNTTIDSLIKLSEEHERSLQDLVDKQEDEREEILLVLGKELLPVRKLHKSKENFGKWVSLNFPNLRDTVNKDEQVAILWAAEFPEQRQQMLDKYPRVKTTRGAYAKWQQENKAEEDQPLPEERSQWDYKPRFEVPDDTPDRRSDAIFETETVLEEKVARKLHVPDYDVATTLGALKGLAEMFSKRYEGTHEDAASMLFSELIKGCEQDDIGMSIARDYVKWFLNFKEVLDMAQPSLEAFLEDKPNLKLVN